MKSEHGKLVKSMKIKLKILLLILLFASASGLYSQQRLYETLDGQQLKVLIPSSTRTIYSLNDRNWEKSYNGKEWTSIDLPKSEPDKEVVIYQKSFRINKAEIEKYTWHLYFLGINDEVDVYFNNQYIGKYHSEMTPLFVTVPAKHINKETNTVKLVVSPAMHSSKIIKEQGIFSKKVYTGVIREILFVGTPQIWINQIKYLTSLRDNNASYAIKANVNVSSSQIERIRMSSDGSDSLGVLKVNKTKVNVEVRLRNKQNGNVITATPPKTIEIERERSVSMDFEVNTPAMIKWSPDSPVLYELNVRISKNNRLIDEYTTNIGFVDIAVKQYNNITQMYINGNPFVFKGIDYIEDYSNMDQTLTAKRMKEDVLMLKTLGTNLIRFKHSPPHPYFAHLCDEYGIFMMIELPVYNIPNSILASKEINVRMTNNTNKLIAAYDNHPSLLAWGVGEGFDEGSDAVLDFTGKVAALFDSLSSKLIYKIVNFSTKQIDDKNFDLIGITDHTIYRSFEDTKDELLRIRNLVKNKPVFVNYGIPIEPENNNGYSDPLSIGSQSYYIKNLFEFVHDNDFVGSLVWSFNDYELDNPLLVINNDSRYLCTTGLVDRQRRTRLSYQTVQALFNEEKEPLLEAGSYREDTPMSFIIIGIILALVLVFFINRYKRFREYITRAVLRPYNFYADIRDQRIMSNVQSNLLGAGIAISLGIFTSSLLFSFKNSEVAQYILMMFVPYNWMRSIMYELIWMPMLMIFISSLFYFGMIYLFAGIIKLFSFFVRSRIFLIDGITITIWSGVPVVILLPFSIILVRLLLFMPGFVYIIGIMGISILIWVLLRIMRATAVVFDISETYSYIIGSVFLGLIVAAALTYYQYNFEFFSYLQYLFSVILSI